MGGKLSHSREARARTQRNGAGWLRLVTSAVHAAISADCSAGTGNGDAQGSYS